MVILRSDTLPHDYSLKEIALSDTKAAILESFNIIHVGIAKSHTKDILATALDHIFHDEPAYFCNALPREEQKLLSALVARPQDQYVEYPANRRQHLLMQKLHLVLTYEAGDTWHLYLPNKIREVIRKMAERDLEIYPELAEFSKLLDEITNKRERLFQLMDSNNPDTLTAAARKKLSDEVRDIVTFYNGVEPRLKKVEPYLKANTDVDLDMIYQDIDFAKMHLALVMATLTFKEHDLTLAALKTVSKDSGMKELTLKVQLDQTPIYRTMKVIDRCSLFELNMLIQFLYDWHDMNPYTFVFTHDGNMITPAKTTRLSAFGLKEGDAFQYKYDMFGDKWIHTLTVLSVESYIGKEEDYEPKCIAGFGPDPGEGAGGNAYIHRNLPYVMKKRAKHYSFSANEINDSFHFWWTAERRWWIEDGTIKYDD